MENGNRMSTDQQISQHFVDQATNYMNDTTFTRKLSSGSQNGVVEASRQKVGTLPLNRVKWWYITYTFCTGILVYRRGPEYFTVKSPMKCIMNVLQMDRLCGLVVRVPGYRSRGSVFDSRRYQIFWEVVDLERGPLSLVRIIEELLEWKSSSSGLENRD
jgi:hypothetical protein